MRRKRQILRERKRERERERERDGGGGVVATGYMRDRLK